MKKLLHFFDALLLGILERILRSTELPEWHASVFRIFFGLFTLFLWTPCIQWLGTIPPSFFNPPYFSLARLFAGFPPPGVLMFLDIAAVLCAVLLTLGIFSRMSGFALWLICSAGSSFQYSFGMIDDYILFTVTLFCFSFSNWGCKNALRPDKPWPFHSLATAVLAICIVFGMFTAGCEKLLAWVDFNLATSGFLSWFYPSYFACGKHWLLADTVFLFPPLMLEAIDYTAVIFELSPFLWLLLGPVYWRGWLIAACLFHLVNTCLLNITFISHMAVFTAFFLYPLLNREKIESSAGFSTGLRLAWVLSGALGLIHIAQSVFGKGSHLFLMPADWGAPRGELIVCAFGWVALAALAGANFKALLSPRTKSKARA